LGQRLREARIQAGYHRARHFAEALGLKENTYCRYERDETSPSYDYLAKICQLLNVEMIQLVPVGGKSDLPASEPRQPILNGFSQSNRNGADLQPPLDSNRLDATAGVARDTAAFIDSGAICSLRAWRLAQLLAAKAVDSNKAASNLLHQVTELYFSLKKDPYPTLMPVLPNGSLKDAGHDPELMAAIVAFLDAYHANLNSVYDGE
jgi:transcriptional regulator with XRE-family HTH domain